MDAGLASLVILICALSSSHGCTEKTASKVYHGRPEGRLICEGRMSGFRNMLTIRELASTVTKCAPVVDQRA